MAVLPVQDDLIDAVIRFASAKLMAHKQIPQFFPSSWRPTSVPTLKTCRKIQGEVRDWLKDPGQAGQLAAWALIGRDLAGGKKKVDPGIALSGAVLFRRRLVNADTNEMDLQVTFDWWVTDAPLRALCGLAVCTIWQTNLKDRVGFCERDECGNYFIDRRSRGERRRYCGTEECSKARSRARTAASRSKR